jgi:hypothetical protein
VIDSDEDLESSKQSSVTVHNNSIQERDRRSKKARLVDSDSEQEEPIVHSKNVVSCSNRTVPVFQYTSLLFGEC